MPPAIFFTHHFLYTLFSPRFACQLLFALYYLSWFSYPPLSLVVPSRGLFGTLPVKDFPTSIHGEYHHYVLILLSTCHTGRQSSLSSLLFTISPIPSLIHRCYSCQSFAFYLSDHLHCQLNAAFTSHKTSIRQFADLTIFHHD